MLPLKANIINIDGKLKYIYTSILRMCRISYYLYVIIFKIYHYNMNVDNKILFGVGIVY